MRMMMISNFGFPLALDSPWIFLSISLSFNMRLFSGSHYGWAIGRYISQKRKQTNGSCWLIEACSTQTRSRGHMDSLSTVIVRLIHLGDSYSVQLESGNWVVSTDLCDNQQRQPHRDLAQSMTKDGDGRWCSCRRWHRCGAWCRCRCHADVRGEGASDIHRSNPVEKGTHSRMNGGTSWIDTPKWIDYHAN